MIQNHIFFFVKSFATVRDSWEPSEPCSCNETVHAYVYAFRVASRKQCIGDMTQSRWHSNISQFTCSSVECSSCFQLQRARVDIFLLPFVYSFHNCIHILTYANTEHRTHLFHFILEFHKIELFGKHHSGVEKNDETEPKKTFWMKWTNESMKENICANRCVRSVGRVGKYILHFATTMNSIIYNK